LLQSLLYDELTTIANEKLSNAKYDFQDTDFEDYQFDKDDNEWMAELETDKKVII
jgi:hypothetical protein